MNLKINFQNLARQLLPQHKRQPVRLSFVRAFLSPLQTLFGQSFDIWRDDARMKINVNSQVLVFEGYLRKKYNEKVAIKIVTFDDGLLRVGLEEEGLAMMPEIGLADEDKFANVPLDGEIRERFGDADFIVYIPSRVNIDLIRAEIEKYKQALIEYKIIQN